MGKNILVILLSAILIFLYFYMNVGKSVEYEVVSNEDSPVFIQDAIEDNHKNYGFSVFQDEKNTFIYYNSNSEGNEYITTDLKVRYKGGKYVATATVKPAVNTPNTNKLVKLSKISDKDLVLKVNIK